MTILISSKNVILLQSLSKYGHLQQLHRKHWMNTPRRHYSKKLPLENLKENSTPKIIPFQKIIGSRRDEANRSILVQVQSAQSFKELHSYCNSIGNVKNMLHYSTGVEPMHFILVEFFKETDVHNIFATSSFLEDAQIVPVQSSFLWFRASTKKQNKIKVAKNATLLIENGNSLPKETEIQDALREAQSICDQMMILHNMTKLNDMGTRLRFLVAKQIEMAVFGMFPAATALPFGSSVNGFGKAGCDLDLVLKLSPNEKRTSEEARLIYHSKAAMGSERSTSQRHMEAIGDLLQIFLPGCSQVRRILQARVPIIKYYQQFADVECDLSMSNVSGVHMSDFLYLMGSIDERVCPLVFTIRKWASQVGITNSSPGRWISNFSLTLLVLAFLQNNNLSPPILPSLNTLIKMSDSTDKFMTEDGVNCTFLRDANKYLAAHPQENKEMLKTLLKQFFEYYSHFDFESKAVCLNEAIPITKPEHSALYIVNPLERGLNVSKNVSLEELEKFKTELRNAAWLLESEITASPNWGLLSLFQSKKRVAVSQKTYSKSKLIEVSKLFDEEGVDVDKDVEMMKKRQRGEIKKFDNSLNLNAEKWGGR